MIEQIINSNFMNILVLFLMASPVIYAFLVADEEEEAQNERNKK